METALINSLNIIWPFSYIKICYFHWNQSMEKQRKKFLDLLEDNISNKESFKSLITLPLIPIDMVVPVFNQLRINNQDTKLEGLFEYYENMFIKKFPPKMWNYCNTEEH